jgi:hypothetical protein
MLKKSPVELLQMFKITVSQIIFDLSGDAQKVFSPQVAKEHLESDHGHQQNGSGQQEIPLCRKGDRSDEVRQAAGIFHVVNGEFYQQWWYKTEDI